MIALNCDCKDFHKDGKDRHNRQRYRCKSCKRRWTEERVKPIGDMRVDLDRAAMALQLTVEGMSMRAISRITNLDKATIGKLINIVGEHVQRFSDKTIQGVSCNFVEADEMWDYVFCRDKTKKRKNYGPETGSRWHFVAIDRETKLVLATHVGCGRDQHETDLFLDKLDRAIEGRFQLTTDGLPAYQNGVPLKFGYRVDFCQLVKKYQNEQEVTRYSPAKITHVEKVARWGNPNLVMASTSFIENWNLQARMGLRRTTRLTNGYSKDVTTHINCFALFVAHWNFCRKHSTLGTTPAAHVGLVEKVLSMKELMVRAAS